MKWNNASEVLLKIGSFVVDPTSKVDSIVLWWVIQGNINITLYGGIKLCAIIKVYIVVTKYSVIFTTVYL